MLTNIQSRLKGAGRWLPVALLPLLPLAARAQALNYAAANATNVAGTYTDLGTTGTAIATTSTDDANSAATPIGFTFNFNGTAFTQFVLNTNGFIKLGATAPSAANLYYAAEATIGGDPFTSTNAADVNILAPFNVDLLSGTTGAAEYRVFTSGAAGSQVCTIQWKNVKDKTLTNSTQYDNFSFQLKLYEGTNNIEFVYGPTVAGTTGADAFRIAASGIKGSGSASGQAVMANKTSSAGAWSTTVFISGSYVGSALNYRRSAAPDAGRTFRFAPTVLLNSDAAVTALYTLGKVSATYGSPVTAQVVVTNTGSTAQTSLPVTLTVSGATTYTNTQTVATLASGASTTLTFTYPVTATTGTNTVTATVPADGLASNNTQTASQAVSAADQSYIQGTTYAGGVGLPLAGNILAVRYTTTATSPTISTVTPTFVGPAATGVTSTYQILLYAATATGQPGTVIYTSPVQTRPTIAGNTTATPAPVSIPGVAVPSTFFVGIRTIGADNIGIGYQTESPLRAGTFLFTTDAGVTWNDLNTQTISPRIALDMTFGAANTCAPVTALAVGSIANTTASVTFTAPAGATGYIVTYTPANGTATTVTPAPTASPVSLTGLTAGTTYTVSVTNNCGTGTSAPVTATFTTTGTAPGPANDLCANAVALPISTTCTNTLGTNLGATASGTTAPAPTCGNATVPGTQVDVWYSVAVPVTGNVTVTTSEVTGSLVDDTVIEVYSGTCGTLTSIGCNDDYNTVDGFSRVALTGLTPGATVYVRVRTYGATDNGQFNICATTTAVLPAPTYVALPYTESFEGPWASVGGTNDVPTINWRNNPATGDNSWRREDDGFTSANWQYLANEVPTANFPIPPYVTRFSTGAHSARFHTFGSLAGEQGSLDLYANLSGTGTKTLSFDFINPTGTDRVDVLVSTDGGATFGATPVLTATTNTTFTNKTVTIPGNSATTVIRFRATSDYGNDDMGIDNLRLSVITATQNAALAATMSLYPNPAHQSFQLTVPAALHAASAQLINALGQVVQTRQLNLPVAGGTADFNVSGLAAGVYSLQLKSGNDLVVKRVVVE
jgi:hypothetical protein